MNCFFEFQIYLFNIFCLFSLFELRIIKNFLMKSNQLRCFLSFHYFKTGYYFLFNLNIINFLLLWYHYNCINLTTNYFCLSYIRFTFYWNNLYFITHQIYECYHFNFCQELLYSNSAINFLFNYLLSDQIFLFFISYLKI